MVTTCALFQIKWPSPNNNIKECLKQTLTPQSGKSWNMSSYTTYDNMRLGIFVVLKTEQCYWTEYSQYFKHAFFSQVYLTKYYLQYATCPWTHPVLLHGSVSKWTPFTGPGVVAAVRRTWGFDAKLPFLSILLARFILVNCGQRRKL